MGVDGIRGGSHVAVDSAWGMPLVFEVARRSRIGILVAAAMGAIIMFAATSLVAPKYTARVTILPQQQEQDADALRRFAGLAGISLPAMGSSEDLYGRILGSNRILDRILNMTWPLRGQETEFGMFRILGIELGETKRDSLVAQHRARKVLREKVMTFSRDRLTGFMELSVTIPKDPVIAAALANRAVALLDSFSREYLKGKAVEQREYTQARLEQVTGEVATAESNLTEFLCSNRTYESSPDLSRRYRDLQREVDAQTAIWLELKQQTEVARLDEHKQLVSIGILDSADPPVKRSGPRRGTFAAFGAILGAMVVICHGAWVELKLAART